MESTAGLTAAALFVLWLLYWLPSLVRHRTELADARVMDRFSGGLRIVAMSGSGRKGGAMMTDHRPRGSGQGVPRVARPTPKGHPLQIMVRGRPLTVERIRRVEKRARRAARARRRLIVSAVLLLCSIGAWALVGFGRAPWGLAVVPSAMLLFVLFLGQRAARAARRADARWTETVRTARQRATQARALSNGGPYAPRNRAQVTGLATRGSDTETQAIPRVGGKNMLDEILDSPEKPKVIEVPVEAAPAAEPEAPARRHDSPPSGRAWDPVPVPLPTYVTKPAAPPRQPAALPSSSSSSRGPTASRGSSGRQVTTGSAGAPPSVPVAGGPSSSASAAGGGPAVEGEAKRGEAARGAKPETLAQPLEEILARRRAAG